MINNINNTIKQVINNFNYIDKKKYGGLKNRSSINYSGVKLRVQKGMGRARVGSRNNPIFIGGGRVYTKYSLYKKVKINKIMINKGLNEQFNYIFNNYNYYYNKYNINYYYIFIVRELFNLKESLNLNINNLIKLNGSFKLNNSLTIKI